MKQRPFGNTGMHVSEIGLGGWQLANPDWGIQDTAEALRIVEKSLEAGCNFFDTAPGYGGGRSEELLGLALRPVREKVIICTKFSHYGPDGTRDFDVENIRKELDGSLQRLGTDYIDLLLLHNPPLELMDGSHAPQYQELERLKVIGKIREYGVSLDWRRELELVTETTKSCAAEVLFNAFHQEPLSAFRKAQEKGLGLIVKVPLDSGWLAGHYRADSRFEGVRSRWSPEVIARRGMLVQQFAAMLPRGTSLAHAALQYCLAQPGVCTVIPGAKSVEQALDNFAAADKQLPDDVVQAIHTLWENELQADPLPW